MSERTEAGPGWPPRQAVCDLTGLGLQIVT